MRLDKARERVEWRESDIETIEAHLLLSGYDSVRELCWIHHIDNMILLYKEKERNWRFRYVSIPFPWGCIQSSSDICCDVINFLVSMGVFHTHINDHFQRNDIIIIGDNMQHKQQWQKFTIIFKSKIVLKGFEIASTTLRVNRVCLATR